MDLLNVRQKSATWSEVRKREVFQDHYGSVAWPFNVFGKAVDLIFHTGSFTNRQSRTAISLPGRSPLGRHHLAFAPRPEE